MDGVSLWRRWLLCLLLSFLPWYRFFPTVLGFPYTVMQMQRLISILNRKLRILQSELNLVTGVHPWRLRSAFTIAAKSASSSVRPLSRQTSLGFQLASHFDERSWKTRFVDWVILEDVACRQASSELLRWLIQTAGSLRVIYFPSITQKFVRRLGQLVIAHVN
jgi:hypothetical protein